ncbi:Wsp signal transduction system sensor histidine kinase WspE [Pseudomonas aeruginosa]
MTPDQMRDASLLELFRLEAEAQTQVLNAGLMALERSPTQADQLEACMRAAHSLKGAARIVGLDAGVRVAHVMEDCLVEAQDGRLLLQSEHIDALLQGCDLLLRIGTPPAGDAGWAEGAGREEIDGLVQRLEGLVRSGLPLARAELPATTPGLGARGPPRAPAAAPAPGPPPPTRPPPPARRDGPPARRVRASAAARDDNDEEPAGQAGGEQAEERRSRVLRVTAERLDRLLDISSKSLVEFQRIKPLADSLQRLRRLQSSASRALDVVRETVQETALDPQAQAMLGEARQLIGECQQMLVQHIADLDEFAWQGGQRAQVLYDAALASRMRPFADVLSGQARMVRDLGRSLGKQVRLLVEGESTQVDRDVLEKLEAPLTHLLRNAVDHGIEAPETRLAAGKPAEGRITIRARHHAGMLVLELSDDGGGIDLQRLRETVLNRQFATAETAAQLSEEELLAFLFLPGFSMREQVTEVSGRGVGLDAVQHMVRQLRGGVRMEQRQGQGTLFHVEVPLTLSVVRSLVVEIGEEAYAFPLAHIERMCELEAEEIVQLEGRQHFWYEGRHVGLVSAAQLLQRPESSRTEGAIPVVVVRDRDAVYGVAVERFVGERTLVVMPLDPRLGKVRDVSAGALLDDGSPVLILDVEDLLHSVGKLLSSGRLERIDRSRRQAGGAQRKRILVVDDSLTVRELERKLLLGRGYDVAVAVDGMDGWNALRSEHFDLLITDIDMPRMDGIELVTLVRRDSRLQSLPVMVVSYKDREEDRRRGLDAGADYYLAKASFHDEALLDAVVVLIGEAQG